MSALWLLAIFEDLYRCLTRTRNFCTCTYFKTVCFNIVCVADTRHLVLLTVKFGIFK